MNFNFKLISLLFILLFSVVGMSNAMAIIHIEYSSNSIDTAIQVYGLNLNNSKVYLTDIQGKNAIFTYPYPTSYDYNHTGEYTALIISAPYGKFEYPVFFYIRNLSNIYTYPSDDMLNLSFTGPKGILGLDNKTYGNYSLPAYY